MKPAFTSPFLLLPLLFMAGMLYAQSADNNKVNTKKKEFDRMTIQKNKETVLRIYEESLNKRNLDLLQELVSDDFTGPGGLKGAAGFREPVMALINAFPDVQWKVEEMIGEGNKIVVRWTVRGTHTAPFSNIAPSGNKFANTGIGFYELKEGKVISIQVYTDRLGFLQQLGVLPDDAAGIINKRVRTGQVRFIDKFLVPAHAKQEFIERVKINRDFIKKLPGFVEDAAYERIDEGGNLVFITVAVWENEEVLQKAKEAVQTEYKKQGFDIAEMMQRLGIIMDRGLYQEAGN